MYLFLAGNFVIMGNKEREKALQKALGKECCRLGSFFYRKEIDIVTDLKGEELNGKSIQKTSSEKIILSKKLKPIQTKPKANRKRIRIIPKKRSPRNTANDQTGNSK